MKDEHLAGAGLSRRTLAWIVALAVVLRLIWALLVPVVPISDSVGYDAFARTLAEHGVFGWTRDEPFAFWPPGTTFLHAPLYKLFGFHYAVIVGFNIALSAGIIITSARVAERFVGARAALATAVILAVWPTLVMYPTILASELPFLFFTIWALDIWTARRGSVYARAVAAGVLIGFAALVRPVALLLPLVYAGALFAHGGFSRTQLSIQFQTGVLALLAMAIVVAPWTWRNYQLFGEPVLISTNGGITLWMGNAPGTDGSYLSVPDELASIPDNEQAKILGARAKQYILDDPAAFLARSVRKLGLLYGNESIGVVWNAEGITRALGEGAVVPLKRIAQVGWACILALAILGFVSLVRQRGIPHALFSPIVVSIAFYSAVYSVTVAQDRYHLSFASQIAILAAIGLLALERTVRSRLAVRAPEVGTT